ncbi:hypothetical protein SAMN05421681_11535 [Lysobacter enzymogenes]|nr:hypothetical protein SAMN05421681_11535 [Lysobacter enzymogenes]
MMPDRHVLAAMIPSLHSIAVARIEATRIGSAHPETGRTEAERTSTDRIAAILCAARRFESTLRATAP